MRIKHYLFIIALVLIAASGAQGQSRTYRLSAGARVIEVRAVPAQARANRVLILWMLKPTKNPRDPSDEIYTCPEETRGSYYNGPTRVSLFDTKAQRIINTVEIRDEHMEEKDVFQIPYKIRGTYYHVNVPAGREGKPTIMWLRDYNGDGRALEFALFDALACMGLETTLVGYSVAQDKVLQYQIHLTTSQDGEPEARVSSWADYLFSQKPLRPGYWKYEIDYRGRGGTLDQYEIRYNNLAERFEGTLVSKGDDQ